MTLMSPSRRRVYLAPGSAEWVDRPQARESSEAVIVRREDEPVLDRESRQLEIRDVVAAQARCHGKICGYRLVPGPGVTIRTAGCAR